MYHLVCISDRNADLTNHELWTGDPTVGIWSKVHHLSAAERVVPLVTQRAWSTHAFAAFAFARHQTPDRVSLAEAHQASSAVNSCSRSARLRLSITRRRWQSPGKFSPSCDDDEKSNYGAFPTSHGPVGAKTRRPSQGFQPSLEGTFSQGTCSKHSCCHRVPF